MGDVKIQKYDEIRAKISTIKEACNFLPDLSNKDGYDKSKRVSLDVGKVLTALEKARKIEKADSLERGRNIDSQAKEIADELAGIQLPHKELYQKFDKDKKEREEKRKKGLEDRVNDIGALPHLMRDSDSNGIQQALEDLENNECLDFYEYTEQALKARSVSVKELSEMYIRKLQYERDQAELAELREQAQSSRTEPPAEEVQQDDVDGLADDTFTIDTDQETRGVKQVLDVVSFEERRIDMENNEFIFNAIMSDNKKFGFSVKKGDTKEDLIKMFKRLVILIYDF